MSSHMDAYGAAQKKALARDLRRQTEEASGVTASSSDYGDCGPPVWSRASWDRFKSEHGFYPFGIQNETFVYPPSFEGAPDWVYELMGLGRRPPVDVVPPPA